MSVIVLACVPKSEDYDAFQWDGEQDISSWPVWAVAAYAAGTLRFRQTGINEAKKEIVIATKAGEPEIVVRLGDWAVVNSAYPTIFFGYTDERFNQLYVEV